jgi:hypothetical protein
MAARSRYNFFVPQADHTRRGPKLLSLTLMFLAAAGLAPAQAQTTPTISVMAQLGSYSVTVPSNFIGFSAEEYDVAYGQIYTPNNTSLISLLQWLGPNGVMRVGGGSSDDVPPDPITQVEISQLGGFVQALGSGWNIIYGLNAAANDPNLAVTQAGYLLNALPSNRVAFQVGNEPDLLYNSDSSTSGVNTRVSSGAVPGMGNEQAWLNVFNRYYQALTGAYGQLNYGAPDTSSTFGYLSWPNDTVLGYGGFQYLTVHKYTLPYGCNYGQGGVPTVQSMFADANEPSNPGWSITEFGIICDGGLNGVTNWLIAATYYLELAQTTAAGGWAGIMPHNAVVPELWGDGLTRPSYYNQFVVQPDGGYAPQGMFYGMAMFARIVGQTTIGVQASVGQQTLQNFNSVAAITATANESGNANILVTNINPGMRGFNVKPDENASWTYANVLVLSGNNCADPEPVLNGQPIGEGGAWGGSLTSIGRGDTVFVGACGAALIEIQP